MFTNLAPNTFHTLAGFNHQHPADVCVTLMLPPAGNMTPHGYTVSCRHLLQQGETFLDNAAAGTSVAVDLDKARRALAQVQQWCAEGNLQSHPHSSVAVFATEDSLQTYISEIALPEWIAISHFFYLKPLLSLAAQPAQFYVLALSQQRPRLIRYEHAAQRTTELPLPLVGEGLHQLDLHAEADMQRHSQTFRVGMGGQMVTMHSHGAGDIQSKAKTEHYFAEVSRAVQSVLRDSDAPLLLAGVDYVLPMYRQVNEYPQLLPEAIAGNADATRDNDLVQAGLTILRHRQTQAAQQALDKYKANLHTQKVTRSFKDIVRWAYAGRIDTLLVAEQEERWGHYFPQTSQVRTRTPHLFGDEGLLNEAIIHTLQHRGTAYTLPRGEMPRNSIAAAVLRY